jgi:hypothetical protein
MEWIKAIGEKKTPPNKTGFVYTMAGDTGGFRLGRMS